MLADKQGGPRSPLSFIPPQIVGPNISNESGSPYGRYASQFGLAPHISSNAPPVFHPQAPALEARLDKIRIVEALLARDAVVHRLEGACVSIRNKQATIDKLQQELDELKLALSMKETKLNEIVAKESVDDKENDTRIESLRLKENMKKLEELNVELKIELETVKQRLQDQELVAVRSPVFPYTPVMMSPTLPDTNPEDSLRETGKRIQTRYAILAQLPIPPNMPSEILRPILIPLPYTIHDFIGTSTGTMKAQLVSYRVFEEYTTAWCPEREEHGYFLEPLFKCVTNPRASTAHRWIPVDLSAKLNKTMECFYHKDGKWYYAGIYKTFRLVEDVSIHEWANLSDEATQAIVKQTLLNRKNTSPQNVYETSQLYAAGALKVACIGLQCVGFNKGLYDELLGLAEECKKIGRWRSSSSVDVSGEGRVASSPHVGLGLGNMGGAWNGNANVGGRKDVTGTKVGQDEGLGEKPVPQIQKIA